MYQYQDSYQDVRKITPLLPVMILLLTVSLPLFLLACSSSAQKAEPEDLSETTIYAQTAEVEKEAQGSKRDKNLPPTSFDECVAAGYPVLRSYPPRCATPLGQVFVGEASAPKRQAPQEMKVCEDRCGDGICAQIVCQAVGCPCAESPANCPQDCVAGGL